MNRTLLTLLIASLAATALGGCIGAPEGTPGLGDTVTVDWTAYDLHSGEQVATQSGHQFVLGSGGSGLGRDFERNLIGQAVDARIRFDSETDPSRPYGQVIQTSRTQLEPFEAVQDIDVASFEGAIGTPHPGMEFQASFYTGIVHAVENGTVTYEIMPEQGQRDVVDFVGIILVTHVKNGMIHQVLEANEGATFAIQSNPFNSNPPLQNLVPGNYRTRGMTETHILYDYASTAHEGLDRPLRFEATVRSVTPAAPAVFDEDAFVARSSPVLLADPAVVLTLHAAGSEATHEPAAGHDDHDDGHDHTH